MFFDEQSIQENLTSSAFSEKSNIAKMFYNYHLDIRKESLTLYKNIIDFYNESINVIIEYLKKNNYLNPLSICTFVSSLIYSGKLYPSNCVFNLVDEGTDLVAAIPGYEEAVILSGHGSTKNIVYFINDIFNRLNINSKICLMETTFMDESVKTIKSTFIKDIKIDAIPDKGDIDVISPKEYGLTFSTDGYYFLYEPKNMLLYSLKGACGKLIHGSSNIKVLPVSYMAFNGISISSMRMNFQVMEMNNFVLDKDIDHIYNTFLDGLLKVKSGEFDYRLSELHYLNYQYNYNNIKRICGEDVSDDKIRSMILK